MDSRSSGFDQQKKTLPREFSLTLEEAESRKQKNCYKVAWLQGYIVAREQNLKKDYEKNMRKQKAESEANRISRKHLKLETRGLCDSVALGPAVARSQLPLPHGQTTPDTTTI